MTMSSSGRSHQSGIPSEMTLAGARFFASDWEASSFIEFFVDLQLRVASDSQERVGRTLARLGDHSRFALQVMLMRSVDSFVSYLGEIEAATLAKRQNGPWTELHLDALSTPGSVPIDVGERFLSPLSHGNVRQLDRLFCEATGVEVFTSGDDVAIFSRLVSIRNLIAHGRTFASDSLASLVDETASVGGLGLRWKDVRNDLGFLRATVFRIEHEVVERWHIPCPVTSEQLFAAISEAAGAVEEEARELEASWLSDSGARGSLPA